MPIDDTITAVIGRTPLVRLRRLPQQFACVADIAFKLEGLNPAAGLT
jgi:cysteine synthase A